MSPLQNKCDRKVTLKCAFPRMWVGGRPFQILLLPFFFAADAHSSSPSWPCRKAFSKQNHEMRRWYKLVKRTHLLGEEGSSNPEKIILARSMASSFAKMAQSRCGLSSTIDLSGPERNQITCQFRSESNLSTNAVQSGPETLYSRLRKPLMRITSSLSRRRFCQVQQNGGIKCVCSGYLHQGGPLPQSHMLAPSLRSRNQFLGQESSFEQLKACTAARLQIAKRKALVSF